MTTDLVAVKIKKEDAIVKRSNYVEERRGDHPGVPLGVQSQAKL